jgi:pimeloyl-ACP methyl ester carboxylesterase
MPATPAAIHHPEARDLPGLGRAYAPAGAGPFPAVLLLHGSEGAGAGWIHSTAILLAMHGFLAYPHGYSIGGDAWHAGDVAAVPIDRTAAALHRLRGCALGTGRAGLYGVSRGAEHGLLVASLTAAGQDAPDALATLAGCDTVHGPFFADAARRAAPDAPATAWTWCGSTTGLSPGCPIEIERFTGPTLLGHGAADRIWSADMSRRLAARLTGAGRPPALHIYENEGHGLRAAAANAHLRHLVDFFTAAL